MANDRFVLKLSEETAPIIQTRACNAITIEPGYKMSARDAEKARRDIQRVYGDPVRIKERKGPSGMYNCHGLTFVLRRGCLVSEDSIDLVLHDDAYSLGK